MKKALLFGASGFIGSHLLIELLNNSMYDLVTIVVRKEPGIRHPKLKTLIGDYSALPHLKNDLIGDDVFITLGTTKKNTPDASEYYKVDHDYPVLAARLAKENGATSVFIVTAVGANADSGFFYVRTKGEIERDILALDFEYTHVFRPSMLLGNRKENRSLEKVLINAWTFINPILAGKKLSRYKGIDGKDVATAMANAASHQTKKVMIYHWQDMKALL